jgi:hypothetical protein
VRVRTHGKGSLRVSLLDAGPRGSVAEVDALAGPYLAAAVLLVLAGAQKARDPKPLVRALRSTGLRVPAAVVRAAAVAELGLGVAALTTRSALVAAGVAASYAAFTGFVLLARARGGVLASCGCFGKADTPPTRTHAVVTGALAVAAAGCAGAVTISVPLLAAATAVAATAYVALAVLPLVSSPRSTA